MQVGRGQFGVQNHLRGSPLLQGQSIEALVVVRGIGIRNQNGWLTTDSQLCQRRCSSPAYHQMCPTVPRCHIVQKGLHLSFERRTMIGLRDRGKICRTSLIDDP